MTRLAYLGSLSLVALACATLPACGQQDEAQTVIAQCTDPAPSEIDSCLEQVRVLNETNPTPQIQNLEARLIQQQVEARSRPAQLGAEAPPPADDAGVSSYDVTPPAPPTSSDMEGGGTYEEPPVTTQDEAPPDTQGDPGGDGTPPDTPPTPYGDHSGTPPPSSDGGPGRGN